MGGCSEQSTGSYGKEEVGNRERVGSFGEYMASDGGRSGVTSNEAQRRGCNLSEEEGTCLGSCMSISVHTHGQLLIPVVNSKKSLRAQGCVHKAVCTRLCAQACLTVQ